MMYTNEQMDNNFEMVKKTEQLLWEIADVLKGESDTNGYTVTLAAYLLYKVSGYNDPFSCDLKGLVDGHPEIPNDICEDIMKKIHESTWDELRKLATRYTSEELKQAVLFGRNPMADRSESGETPASLVQLAQRILNIQANERVMDIGCGYGSFLVASASEEPAARYAGVEINLDRSRIVELRAELLGQEIQVDACNAFDLVNDNERVYDKIFSNYPFKIRMGESDSGAKYFEGLSKENPELSRATSSDWYFNALLCDLLAPGGKAVGIMTNGSTWNTIDSAMRKYFAEKKLIECVIALPGRMFYDTNIPTTMIVFSHHNESVRMVDATEIYQKGRRYNEFSQQDIENILRAVMTDGENSQSISLEEMRENEYALNLSRYRTENIQIEGGVPFETVIKKITRGAPCTAKQLDDMASDQETNMQYLMLANIQDGMIAEDLPYLSEIDSKYEKYCLKDNDLILSKNGYPYKVAVASVRDDQKILANGNLYIIELNQKKILPYYLKAFFESDTGVAALKSITVGATIPNIGVDKLKKLCIPVPPMEEQERIAGKYREALDEIEKIQGQLKEAMERLHHIFDDNRKK